MLRIKLQRIGKKKQAFFRLIIQEKGRNPHDKSLEILGWLNPRTKAKELKKERIAYWLSQGAEPTDTLHNLFIDEGILTGEKNKTVKISKIRAGKIADKNKKAAEALAVKEAVPAVAVEAPEEEKPVVAETEPVESVPTETAPAPEVVTETPIEAVPEVKEEKKEEVAAEVVVETPVEEKPAE